MAKPKLRTVKIEVSMVLSYKTRLTDDDMMFRVSDLFTDLADENKHVGMFDVNGAERKTVYISVGKVK